MKQRTTWREHARHAQRLRLRYFSRAARALWRHWRDVRHAEAELRALDARELGDIGLTPGNIPAVARGLFLEAGARHSASPSTARAAD
jgi:uncharacterized protein YjiS (DUF1127 family)